MNAIIITIFSFFLEATLSLYVSIMPHYLTILATFVSLLYSSRYFIHSKNYYYFCFIIGILYDIAFTNTLLFHGVLFVFLGYLYQIIEKRFSDIWYSFLFSIALFIFIYRTLSYLLLVIVGYLPFTISLWISVILSSFLFNLFYAFILYVLNYLFYTKKKSRF